MLCGLDEKVSLLRTQFFKSFIHQLFLELSAVCQAGPYGVTHSYTIRMHTYKQVTDNSTWWCHPLMLKKMWDEWLTDIYWECPASHPRWLFDWLMKNRGKIAKVCVGGTWRYTIASRERSMHVSAGFWKSLTGPDNGSEASKPGAWGLSEKMVVSEHWCAWPSLFWVKGRMFNCQEFYVG